MGIMMQRTCNWIREKTEGVLHGSPVDKFLLVNGVSTDSRMLQENQLYIPLVGERFDGHDFLKEAIAKGAAAALWEEGRALPIESAIPIIVVSDTLLALQQLAANYREELAVQVIGITGSNGKTTTKDLISSVFSIKYKTHKTQGNLNNHIGVPLTILSMPGDTEIAIIEMGMNHAGEIRVLSSITKPDMVIITNIGESHLEFLGSREGITQAKLEIKEGLKDEGIIVFDGDEPLLINELTKDPHKQIRVGWGKANDYIPSNVEAKGFEGSVFQVEKLQDASFYLPLMGRHNIKNALYAIAAASSFSLSHTEMSMGLQQMKMAEMRLEINVVGNGMKVINDTYNSSPTSVQSSIETLLELDSSMEKWVLLGDMNELGKEEERYHCELGEYLATTGISRIYTIGDRGRWISLAARKADPDPMRIIHHFTSRTSAAKELIEEGHNHVLLLVKSSRSLHLEEVITYLSKGE